MKYIVIGGSIAGVTAAQAIRRTDPDAVVHVFGEDPYPFYRRPLLWKFIAGEIDIEAVFFRPVEWYGAHGITLRLGQRAIGLDTAARRVTFEDGTAVAYDRLLLATGAHCFVPPCPGADKEGVFTLRTLENALAIKAYAEHSSRALVIGGGLLGLETARALQSLGLETTVVEFMPHLLPRQLDAEGSVVLQSILQAQGLDVVTGAATEEVVGGSKTAGIRLKSGREIPGELVLFSTGIRSNIDLARQAGLETNRGVIINDELHASASGVFAVGDVAEFRGTVYGTIPAAVDQARAAGANMASPHSATYKGTLPSTTLKVAGAQVACLGESTAKGAEYVNFRHVNLKAGIYRKLVLRDDKLVGAILLNSKDYIGPVTQLVKRAFEISDYAKQIVGGDFDLGVLL